MDGRGETSRSTPAYSEPWMRRERINVSVHSIYAIVCRSPRQTKRLGFRCLLCFNILCPFHLIILTQCYLLREAYVCALCVYLVLILIIPLASPSNSTAESPAYKLPVFLLQLHNLLSVKMAVFGKDVYTVAVLLANSA